MMLSTSEETPTPLRQWQSSSPTDLVRMEADTMAEIIAALAGAPVIGVPLLTAAGDVAGWHVAFIGAGLGAVAVAALVAAWLPSDEPGTSGSLRWRALRNAYHPLLRHRPVQRFYAASVLRAICWFGLLTYLGAFLDEELGLGTRRVGLA